MIPDVPELEWEDECKRPDYHGIVSIQLCELIDEGWFDLSKPEWDFGPKYSDEQHRRLCEKITNHFYTREIAIVPPGLWKREFLRRLNEVMPKYIPLYRLLDEEPEAFGASSEYYKSRNIYSDFPQTQLNGNNGDYASSGNDMEFQRVHQLDILDLAERLNVYKDVDLMVIDEVEPLFSCLYTVNVNAM